MNERQMVLKMLEEGKITAEEATRLLEALREKPAEKNQEHQEQKKNRDDLGGFGAIPRAAGEMLQTLARELGDVLKDLPGSIAHVMRDLNQSRDFQLEESVAGIKRLEIVGARDSWRFRRAEGTTLAISGRMFYSARGEVDEKVPPNPVLRKEGECLILDVSALDGSHYRLEGECHVPDSIEVECCTKSGSIDARGLRGKLIGKATLGRLRVREHAGDMKLRTKGGTIRVRDVDGNLDAEAKNGSVRADDVRGDARISCSNGVLELDRPGGSVDLSAVNGSLRVRYEKEPAGDEHRIESRTGMIQLTFAPGIPATVTARTKLGAINVDSALETSRFGDEIQIGGGGARIRVETGLGAIRIDQSAKTAADFAVDDEPEADVEDNEK